MSGSGSGIGRFFRGVLTGCVLSAALAIVLMIVIPPGGTSAPARPATAATPSAALPEAQTASPVPPADPARSVPRPASPDAVASAEQPDAPPTVPPTAVPPAKPLAGAATPDTPPTAPPATDAPAEPPAMAATPDATPPDAVPPVVAEAAPDASAPDATAAVPESGPVAGQTPAMTAPDGADAAAREVPEPVAPATSSDTAAMVVPETTTEDAPARAVPDPPIAGTIAAGTDPVPADGSATTPGGTTEPATRSADAPVVVIVSPVGPAPTASADAPPLTDPLLAAPRPLVIPDDPDLGVDARRIADTGNPPPVAVIRTDPLAAAPTEAAGADLPLPGPNVKPGETELAVLTPPPGTEPPPTAAPAAPATVALAPLPTAPARQLYAARFDATEARPLLSILLEVVPEGGADLAGILSLNLPISFVVASNHPRAAAVTADLRRAGYEVFLRPAGQQTLAAGLPRAAVAARLDEALALVPEAVGVIDWKGDLARSSTLATPVLAELALRGHVALTGGTGALNVFGRMAKAAGVAHLAVEREIDETRDAAAIAKALDRAAFSARNGGGAIALGHTRPETVQALLAWALAKNNRQVTLAPVTVQLR